MSNSCCNTSSNTSQLKIYEYYNSIGEGKGPYEKSEQRFSPEQPLKKILNIINDENRVNIVDLGSGMADSLIYLSENSQPDTQLIGVDFSETMIEKAKDRIKNIKIENIEFIHSSIENVDLGLSTRDLVYSECVLNLLSDRKKTLQNIYNSLKDDGVFIYSDFVSFKAPIADLQQNDELVCGCKGSSLTLSENIKYLEMAGFHNIEVFDYTSNMKEREDRLFLENPKILEERKHLISTNSNLVNFIDNSLGYYLIIGRK